MNNAKKNDYYHDISKLEEYSRRITLSAIIVNIVFVVSLSLFLISIIFKALGIDEFLVKIGFISLVIVILGLICSIIHRISTKKGDIIFDRLSNYESGVSDELGYIIRNYNNSSRLFPLKKISAFIIIFIFVCVSQSTISFSSLIKIILYDSKTIVIANTKPENEEQLKILCKNYSEKHDVEIKIFTRTGIDGEADTDIDPISGIPDDTYIDDVDEVPTLYILDEIDVINNVKKLYDLKDVVYNHKFCDEWSVKNANKQVVGLPFIIEGFGMVLKTPKDEIIKTYKGITLENFLNEIDNNNKFHIIGDTWAYSSHLMSLSNNSTNHSEEPIEIFKSLYELSPESSTCNVLSKFIEGFIKDYNARFCFTGSWNESEMISKNDTHNFSFIPIPMENGDKIVIGPTKYIAINKSKSKNKKKIAVDFINWLCNKENDKVYTMGLICGLYKPDENNWNSGKTPLSNTIVNYLNENYDNPANKRYYDYEIISRETRNKLDAEFKKAFANRDRDRELSTTIINEIKKILEEERNNK